MKLILKKEEFIFDERDDSKNLTNINTIHLMLLLHKEDLGLIFDLIRNIESGNLYAVFEQLDSSIAKEFLKISMSRPIENIIEDVRLVLLKFKEKYEPRTLEKYERRGFWEKLLDDIWNNPRAHHI